MAGEDHCSMDDDPPTYGMCHLRLWTPDGGREDVERIAGLSDGHTMLCVAGDFNAHIGVVGAGDE